MNRALNTVEPLGSIMSMFGEEGSGGRLDQHFMSNVRFQFDDDPDPYKRRKKNMKNALRVLKPKRSRWPPWGPKHNNPGQCCVTGIDLRPLGYEGYDRVLLDPQTLQPVEDGRTLITEFFQDSMTGKPTQFNALTNVVTGIPLRSSYAPGLLQIYWLYTQWSYEAEMEKQGTSSSFLRSRGIEIKPLRRKSGKQQYRPPLVDELEPFYLKCKQNEGRGVNIIETPNPESGEVDFVTIQLDLRKMRIEALQAESSIASTTTAGTGQGTV